MTVLVFFPDPIFFRIFLSLSRALSPVPHDKIMNAGAKRGHRGVWGMSGQEHQENEREGARATRRRPLTATPSWRQGSNRYQMRP